MNLNITMAHQEKIILAFAWAPCITAVVGEILSALWWRKQLTRMHGAAGSRRN
jgi:hypothetical protein